MRYIKFWLVVILSATLTLTKGQEADSLHALFNGLPDNEQKLPVLMSLSKAYTPISIEKAIYYANEQRQLASRLREDHWLARSYFSLAYLHNKQGYLGKAVQNYVLAIDIFKREKDLVRLADSYYNLADLFLLAEDYLNARLYFLETLNICKEQNITDFLSWIYLSIGETEVGLEMYDQALTSYQQALKVAKEDKNDYMINFLYNNIGLLYKDRHMFDLARDNFYESIKIEQLAAEDIAIAYNNIGETYLEEKDILKAQEFFYKSLIIKDSLQQEKAKIITYLNLGKSFIAENNYVDAKIYLDKAVDLTDANTINKDVIETLNIINEIHNLEANKGIYPTGEEMLKYENIQTKQLALINNLNDELAPLKNRYLLQVNYEVPMLSTQLSQAISSKKINSTLAIIAGILALITIGFMAYYMRKVLVAKKMLSKF